MRGVHQHIGGVVLFDARVGALRVGGPHPHPGVIQRAHVVRDDAHERLRGLDAAERRCREQATSNSLMASARRALETRFQRLM